MKVLLVTDGTEFSDFAIEKLLQLNLSTGSEVKVLSVVDVPMPIGFDPIGGMINYAEIEQIQREQVVRIVESAAAKIQTVRADLKVISETTVGSPESRIVEVAEEWNADLIVVGSHGYKAWERLLLGSVSNAVVHHAPCSVLVARKPK